MLKAKRLMSIVLAVLMTMSMLTAFVIPTVSAETVPAIWSEVGLAPVGDETYVDLATQDKYAARTNGREDNFIFIALDWTEYAYTDASLTTLSGSISSNLETTTPTAAGEKRGDRKELVVGTEFYAKMPTTGIIYKLTYGVTASNLYQCNTSQAATIVMFPGTYSTSTGFVASGNTVYSTSSTHNSNFVIGYKDFEDVLVLGPHAGVAAGNTTTGAATRSITSGTEAVFGASVFYTNGILDDGDSVVIDGIAGTGAVNFGTYVNATQASKIHSNANKADFVINNALLQDYDVGEHGLFAFKAAAAQGSVGVNPANNKVKMYMTLSINDSYIENAAADTNDLYLGKVILDEIHIDGSVIKSNRSDITRDSMGFYINPTKGTNYTAKHGISYTCDNSYLNLPNSYLFGVYYEGTSDITSETRSGIEIRFDNNIMQNCGLKGANSSADRDALYIAFSPDATILGLTDLIFTDNTVTATEYPDYTDTISNGQILQPGEGTFNKVDISGNVFTGYGIKSELFSGMNDTVDVSDNAYLDLDGSAVAPMLGGSAVQTSVMLNGDMTAKLSDFIPVSGGVLSGEFGFDNDGTEIYDDISGDCVISVEQNGSLTAEQIISELMFFSPNVTATSIKSGDADVTGLVILGDVYTLTATHALTGKSVTFSLLIKGLLPGATYLKDTAYSGRYYYDNALTAAEGSSVTYTLDINGTPTLVQFTVGTDLFAQIKDIPVVNNERHIYMFAKEYTGTPALIGSADSHGVNNYFYGAQAGVSGVTDTDGDDIADAINPARTDMTKETVWKNHIVQTDYQNGIIVDGVAFAGMTKIVNTAANLRGYSSLVKVVNSVTDILNPIKLTDINDQFIGSKNGVRTNIEVADNFFELASTNASNIITAGHLEDVNIYNNVMLCDNDKSNAMYLTLGNDGSTTTYSTGLDLNIYNNTIVGKVTFTDMATAADIPVSIEVDNNDFLLDGCSDMIYIGDFVSTAGVGATVATADIVFSDNTFAIADGTVGNAYIVTGEKEGQEELTITLKNNTFDTNDAATLAYAIQNQNAGLVDASENNTFNGFDYNFGNTDYALGSIVAYSNGNVPVLLSNGDNYSTVVIGGVEYAANYVDEEFALENILSDKAVVESTDVVEYLTTTTTDAYYYLNTAYGMMFKVTVGQDVYYNAVPMTAGFATAELEIIKINGETADGLTYALNIRPYCDHTDCYLSETPFDVKDPTCGDGYIKYYCPNNNEVIAEIIPGRGNHSYGDGVITVYPNCTEDGAMTSYCSVCGAESVQVLENRGGHVWDSWTNIINVTCISEGLRERNCTFCRAVDQEPIAIIEHIWSEDYIVVIPATGTIEGFKAHYCRYCGAEDTELISIGYCTHENTTGEWFVEVEPDCLEDGVKYQICADCGDICNSSIIVKLPHNNIETGILTPVTCTTDGLMGIYCLNCGQSGVETIYATGHVMGIWHTDAYPTCEDVGYKTRSCTVCLEVLASDTLPTISHSYVWVVVVPAGCDTDGYSEYICRMCGDVVDSKVLTKLGHRDVFVTSTPATCTEDGERVYECAVCGYDRTEAYAATGHTAGKWKITKIATTLASGKRVKECVDCGIVLKTDILEQLIDQGNNFVDVPANIWYAKAVNFMYNAGLVNGTDATHFTPDMTTSRGMFVTILGRLTGVDASQYTNAYFEDVKDNAYYFGYIEWARVSGIVQGTGNYVFQPDRAITRQEMCKMIISYADFAEIELENKEVKKTFKDDAKIATWAKKDVYTCQRAAIINGDSAGTFRPIDTATRAETAKLIMNFYVNYIQ